MTARLRLLLTAALFLVSPARADPDLVVVVSAQSGVERLSADDVVNIFMGRYRQLPTGIAAVPVDQPEARPERAHFYRLLVNKDLAEINAYWARLLFSGKTSPPRQVKSTAEMLELLAKQPGAIGYLDSSQVDARFRAVLNLER